MTHARLLAAAAAARRIDIQMLQVHGRGAVLVGVARVDRGSAASTRAPIRSAPPPESLLCNAGAAVEPPVDPALRDYLLLITILVAFLDAAGEKLAPLPPAVVMQFSGLTQ
jgi:hypothetical protein